MRKFTGWFMTASLSLMVSSISGSANAGDIKAYPSAFCAAASVSYDISQQPWRLRANGDASVVCPIIRDETNVVGLPRVYLEAEQQSTSDTNLFCNLVWIDEDANAGQIRGWSDVMTATTTGDVQFVWDALNEFDDNGNMSPPALMSTGGEGTIQIQCTMEYLDTILHYHVEENYFN